MASSEQRHLLRHPVRFRRMRSSVPIALALRWRSAQESSGPRSVRGGLRQNGPKSFGELLLRGRENVLERGIVCLNQESPTRSNAGAGVRASSGSGLDEWETQAPFGGPDPTPESPVRNAHLLGGRLNRTQITDRQQSALPAETVHRFAVGVFDPHTRSNSHGRGPPSIPLTRSRCPGRSLDLPGGRAGATTSRPEPPTAVTSRPRLGPPEC
jgi:hypothetical protein